MYWLMKSEPNVYSWDQLMIDRRAKWDGVRNHQAAANMRAMVKGDEVFFYHSQTELAIRGIMKIVKTFYPDPSDPTARFVNVDVAPVRALVRPVTLREIKADRILRDMVMIKQMRLSVSPVTAEAWTRVLEISEN